MAANTATLAHNQFRVATTSQALKPMNTSDASTSADFPRRAEPEPDYRCGGHHAEHTDQSEILKAYPDGGDRGSVVRTGGQEVSGERVGDRRCGELAQRHGGRYPTPHPYRGGRWLVCHAGIIGVVV